MAVLWTILAIVAIFIAVLLYGEGHGLFRGITENAAPSLPSWQMGWP
jgi:hypothetical protein